MTTTAAHGKIDSRKLKANQVDVDKKYALIDEPVRKAWWDPVLVEYRVDSVTGAPVSPIMDGVFLMPSVPNSQPTNGS